MLLGFFKILLDLYGSDEDGVAQAYLRPQCFQLAVDSMEPCLDFLLSFPLKALVPPRILKLFALHAQQQDAPVGIRPVDRQLLRSIDGILVQELGLSGNILHVANILPQNEGRGGILPPRLPQ